MLEYLLGKAGAMLDTYQGMTLDVNMDDHNIDLVFTRRDYQKFGVAYPTWLTLDEHKNIIDDEFENLHRLATAERE